MLKVLDAIEKSTDYLKKKGIDSPRINADLLLADILNCRRLDLYLKFDQPLSKIEIDRYRDYIARRGKFEPLQYILGYVEFYGMKFRVSPEVLIPRQETEILVEEIINECKDCGKVSILDIGAGSGNIAVSLSKLLPDALVTGIDISKPAIEIAMKNARLNGVGENIKFVELNILDEDQINSLSNFDIVVSNPPYVSCSEYANLQKEITEFEPKIAVTDFDDGLTFYENICKAGKKILANSGKLFFELGDGQSDDVKRIMKKHGYSSIQIVEDYLKIKRIIFGEKE